MTNGEQADRLMTEAGQIAGELQNAVAAKGWNLAARRAQEVVELVVKALLAEMGVDYPRTHDPMPVFAEAVRRHSVAVEESFVTWLSVLSAHLAEIRAPAFYHELQIAEAEAREAVDGAERAPAFGRALLSRLRGTGRGE